MFFNRRKKETPNEDGYGDYSSNFSYPDDEDNVDELLIESEKKRAFYNALHGRTLEQLLDDLSTWVSQQILRRYTSSNKQTQLLQQRISEIEEIIREKLVILKDTDPIEERYIEEISTLEGEMEKLDEEFVNLVDELGEAHKNLISNRIREAEEELSKLVDMYHNVFKKKYENEGEFKKALESKRKLVDTLIEDKTKKLDIIQQKITSFYKLGGSKLSTTFLTSVGLLSAITAGYYFSSFSNADSFTNQNWLFFGLSNLFNYLFLYVEQFGPLDAVKGMLINFILLLTIITTVIWITQYALQKITNDRPNIELSVNSEQKKSTFFKLQISSKSALSFWLQLIPWIFILGLVFIMLTVGQYIGAEQDQLGELEKRLSGQIIGTTITLICTAIFYLYMTKIVEPRKTKETTSTDEPKVKKRKNRELIILVIGINILLGIIIINQVLESQIPNSHLIFSVLCFVLLLNLTAFTLSYGLMQKGLFRTNNEIESRINYLTNLRISLSGSKPISLWIREANSFDRSFLAIRRDIDDLSRTKSFSLNQLKKTKRTFGFLKRTNPKAIYSAERFGEMNKSTKRESQFFLHNFPELSYKIAKVRNDMNAAKRDLDLAQMRLRELHEGHSDFQTSLKDEIRDHESNKIELQKTSLNIRESTDRFIQKMEEEKRAFELHLMQGFELGTWTKDQLIDVSLNEITT